MGRQNGHRIEWMRCLPFFLLHAGCFAVFLVGWSWFAVTTAVVLYLVRMFAITGFYHRYFSHKTFKTSRAAQFAFAVIGNSAAQRGPLWWAGWHRHHHAHSDKAVDMHSPMQHGLFRSHVGWFLTGDGFLTKTERVRDLSRFPELRFLDRFDWIVPTLLGVSIFALGWILEVFAPSLGTTAWQMFVWGFVVSTVVLFHATFSINSLAHLLGKRRFETRDTSRNHWFLALLTLGEGWHNNHHYYPASTRQGFYWWEYDPCYWVLRGLAFLGIVWDLQPVPERILEQGRNSKQTRPPRRAA
ncbi:MAG: acyl-CoA desaturase [Planctomycetes bacterium]|nr:acyl-CoA desaturase [Planctomycetota bacterium]